MHVCHSSIVSRTHANLSAAFGVLLCAVWLLFLAACPCCAHEGGRNALLSHLEHLEGVTVVLARGGVWRPAEWCAAHCEILGTAEHLRLMCC